MLALRNPAASQYYQPGPGGPLVPGATPTTLALNREQATALMQTFPTIVGPVTSAVLGLGGAIGAAVLDEYFESSIKLGPLGPAELASLFTGVLALWTDNPDASAALAALTLGGSAPGLYIGTRGWVKEAREEAKKRKEEESKKTETK